MKIRLATTQDTKAMLEIYSPNIVSNSISFEYTAPTEEEFKKRIDEIGKKYPWIVAEIDGTCAGYAYASEYRTRKAYQWCVEVTIYVHAKFQGRGVGRALYTDLFQRLRHLGYYNAYAIITLPNDKSVRLHESMGFKHIGVFPQVGYKMGQWHDVGWWQLRLQPDQNQAPIAPKNV
jgi:L-amino acid N-acyltransferase YncA